MVEESQKGVEVFMCSVLDEAEARGLLKGKIEAYITLLREGVITRERVMQELGVSEEKLQQLLDEL